jgi:hypothetical protein
MVVPTLVSICHDKIIKILEQTKFYGKHVNDLCKYVPTHLLEPIFTILIEKGIITDTSLLAYLIPNRTTLKLHKLKHIRNSIFKQIGFNCPYLLLLDLSDCLQVSNSVIRIILQNCHILSELYLNRCHRITDQAFDFLESPFYHLLGCLSLELISLQGCPQITGDIIKTLNKYCRKLKYLNLSQCKNVVSSHIQHIFEHNQLQILNLAYIDDISDEAFILLPSCYNNNNNSKNNNILNSISYMNHTLSSQSSLSPTSKSIKSWQSLITSSSSSSSLLKLNLCRSKITDISIYHMIHLNELIEIRLQYCYGITDVGIIALTKNCPKLKLIDLTSCAITDQSLLSIGK